MTPVEGVPVQGATQPMVASHPAFKTEPSEINLKVNSPPDAVERKLPGKVVPLNPPTGCKAGDKVEGPS